MSPERSCCLNEYSKIPNHDGMPFLPWFSIGLFAGVTVEISAYKSGQKGISWTTYVYKDWCK